MSDDNPDREFYDLMFPRRGHKLKRRIRHEEAPAKRPNGFLSPRSRSRGEIEAEEQEARHDEFIAEMEAIGRYDIVDDDSEAFVVAFDRWLRKRELRREDRRDCVAGIRGQTPHRRA